MSIEKWLGTGLRGYFEHNEKLMGVVKITRPYYFYEIKSFKKTEIGAPKKFQQKKINELFGPKNGGKTSKTKKSLYRFLKFFVSVVVTV